MFSTSSSFPRLATGLARRCTRSSTPRIVTATVTAHPLRPPVPPGFAVVALAAVLMLGLPATSLGAGGEQPRARYDGAHRGLRSSSAVLRPGSGYAAEGGSRIVRQLQRRLRRSGYTTGPVDGLYGPRTARAVRRFQRAHGLVPDGAVGPQTNAALTDASWPGGDAVRPGAGYGTPGGSDGVRAVQRMLRSAGYDPGPVDGLFGPRTQAAVQWFQAKGGIRPTGVFDPASLSRLRGRIRNRPAPNDLASPRRLEAPPLPSAGWHGRPIRNPQRGRSAQAWGRAHTRGPDHPLQLGAGYRSQGGSQRVRRVQRMLHELGYHSGPVDGRLGPRTRASIQWIQLKYGLEPSGSVDAATLGALERGQAPGAREHAKTPPADSRDTAAQPGGRRANAHASGQHGSPVSPLLLALLGALGAGAVLLVSITARSRRRDSGTGPAAGGAPTRSGEPSREPDPRPGAATASAPNGAAPDPRPAAPTASAPNGAAPDPRPAAPTASASNGAPPDPRPAAPTASAPNGAAPDPRPAAPTASAPNGAPPDPRPAAPTASASNGAPAPPDPRPAAPTAANGAAPDPRPAAPTASASNGAPPDPRPAAPTASAPNGGAPDPSTTAPPPPPESGGQPSPRVVGYARGRNRDDLEHQAAAIERACRERGWTLARVVRDNGSDESMALTRPGLAHALDQLRGGSAARLVVDRLERLGRSVTDLRPLIQWCASNDVDLVALEGGLDASMPEAEPALEVGNGHEDAPKVGRRRWKRSKRAWTQP